MSEEVKSNGLPKGWALPAIRELIELGPKGNHPDDLDVGFVPMPLMGTRFCEPIRFEKKKWCDVKKGYTHFRDGDVLLAKITPCFENGKGGIARGLPNGVGAGSTEYFVCRPNASRLVTELLHAFLKTREFMSEGETQMTGSVGHKRVPKDLLLDTQIPLAPLAEQKRIADKLEAVLGRVDACRARLDRVPALLKRFRQSVLAAATNGSLTAEWRMTNGVNDEWETVKLGRLLTDIRYGTAKKCRYEPIATPVLRIPNIGVGQVTLNDIKYAEFDQKEIRTLALKSGDLLVIRSNGSVELVGRVALVSEKEAGFLYAGYLIRLRINGSQARVRPPNHVKARL